VSYGILCVTSSDDGSLIHRIHASTLYIVHAVNKHSFFVLTGFERTIESIRCHVAEELWTLIVEYSNLKGTYEKLRKFYLLGDGQLIALFISLARPIVQAGPPTLNTEHDVNNALTRAAVLLNPLAEDTDVEERRVKLLIDDVDSTPKLPSTPTKHGIKDKRSNGWNLISMKYIPEWPLHFVFTTTVLERYNRMFKFLLSIKQVESELHQSWIDLLPLKNSHLTKYLPVLSLTRSHMSFVLDNL
jgi:hypothetical protein